MKQMDRRALFASGAAAALLAASGLSAAPKRGGHLRAALSGGSREDTWCALGGNFQQAAASTLFEGLTELAADGTLRGALALDWTRSDDGRDWRFSLRDTTFHDGIALNAKDVCESLTGLGRINADDNVIRIQLETADPNLPYTLTHPKYLIKPADPQRVQQGIGTGLYALRRFDAGRHFIAERVAKHWKDGMAGWLDKVEFVHFADDAVRAQALREGLVDVADISDLDTLADPQDFQRLPTNAQTMQIINRRIAVPMQVGRAYPLDNLRMAERWWIA